MNRFPRLLRSTLLKAEQALGEFVWEHFRESSHGDLYRHEPSARDGVAGQAAWQYALRFICLSSRCVRPTGSPHAPTPPAVNPPRPVIRYARFADGAGQRCINGLQSGPALTAR
jgi:hypothetical protein